MGANGKSALIGLKLIARRQGTAALQGNGKNRSLAIWIGAFFLSNGGVGAVTGVENGCFGQGHEFLFDSAEEEFLVSVR